jgi:hypothetical protein
MELRDKAAPIGVVLLTLAAQFIHHSEYAVGGPVVSYPATSALAHAEWSAVEWPLMSGPALEWSVGSTDAL